MRRGKTPSPPSTRRPMRCSPRPSTAARTPGAAPPSTLASPSSTEAGRSLRGSMPATPRATPATSCRRSPAPCRRGVPSSRCRAPTCSARRQHRRDGPGPRGPGAPAPPRIRRSRRPTTGARSPSSPTRSCLPAAVPPRAPNPPAPTRGGGHRASTCRARSSTRRLWCSRAPWRRCRTPCRPTARCCPPRWWPRGCSPTRNSRASSSPATLTSVTSPPSTASAPAGRHSCRRHSCRRPCSAPTPRAMRATIPLRLQNTTASLSTQTSLCPIRCASGAAGCWATAPAAAREGRSLPSSLDQWLRGRKRALWLSQSDKLLEDARRDWCAIGGRARRRHSTRQGAPGGRYSPCARNPLRHLCHASLPRPGRGSPPASTRSSPGSRTARTRTGATPIRESSSSTRRTPWPTRRGRRARAAR